MTLSAAIIREVAKRAGVTELEVRRALLGLAVERRDRIEAALIRSGIDTSHLRAIASARDPRPSRVNAATVSIRSDETNPTERT